jgi:addiction module RelE/StbE family toxin
MALEVVWSDLALTDVEEIARYISRDSVRYANAMVARFFAAAERVADFPRMGRVVPERKDERYREVIVGAYRLIYKVTDARVEVLAVVHGARLLDRAVGDRLPTERGGGSNPAVDV